MGSYGWVFDTSLEAEYTPTFAKALATAVLEAIANEFHLPHVSQHAKKLKLSHIHAIAAAKADTCYATANGAGIFPFDYSLQFAISIRFPAARSSAEAMRESSKSSDHNSDPL